MIWQISFSKFADMFTACTYASAAGDQYFKNQ